MENDERPEVPAPRPIPSMTAHRPDIRPDATLGAPVPTPDNKTSLGEHAESLDDMLARMGSTEDLLITILYRLRGASKAQLKGGPLPADAMTSTLVRIKAQEERLHEISDHLHRMADELNQLV
jgi:hypothetical protein